MGNNTSANKCVRVSSGTFTLGKRSEEIKKKKSPGTTFALYWKVPFGFRTFNPLEVEISVSKNPKMQPVFVAGSQVRTCNFSLQYVRKGLSPKPVGVGSPQLKLNQGRLTSTFNHIHNPKYSCQTG